MFLFGAVATAALHENGSICCCPIDFRPRFCNYNNKKEEKIHCTLLKHHGVPSKIAVMHDAGPRENRISHFFFLLLLLYSQATDRLRFGFPINIKYMYSMCV